MDVQTFLRHVEEHFGPIDERTLRAPLDALASELPAPVARSLASGLPEPWCHRFEAAAGSGERASCDRVRASVARRLRLGRAQSMEIVAAVCRAVGEVASPEARRHLAEHLPADLAALFEPPPPPSPRPPHRPPRRLVHSLAAGRPTTPHPLDEPRH